ncbi:Histone-lysine N-methyltransferase EHMT1 [Oryzias melastigma]|uniref:Histone-lysine N-methyltransferase EHMT1 n=1 Tax=Oryzias melastigma TaxID=30732 RepID=A0A834F976_ORYME|nr:histone-lysine N-methyltransferase EHMT1 isoform X1 [Oryzias melastigma]XP_024120285.1 histone-lysine N-methyltransferase EHMT1 isoform X1 [Oryzias melastigma]KAF6726036.1 Histone-lysine N-methyltransferase EHMT1 [Oryzias melastigma]
MDQAGAPQGPNRSSSSSPLRPPTVLKQPRPESSQRLTVTPFHRSAVISSDAALYRKRMAGKHGGPFLGALLREPPPSSSPSLCASTDTQSGSSERPNVSLGSAQNVKKTETPVQGLKSLVKDPEKPNIPLPHGPKRKGGGVSTSIKAPAAVKKKKRKMGLYNLVPKKKTKACRPHEKKEEKKPSGAKETVHTRSNTGNIAQDPAAVSVERSERAEASLAEYTELALDCLDLKAQEELLSPPLSGAAGGSLETDAFLAEELPLCCCRMETPNSVGSTSTLDQTCMATESADGVLSRCQRPVMKMEMMRPSNMVHLLVLCEDHRAGMVKHQCCPGCGLFCRTGSFMECRPYGSISHRFHQACASVLKGRRFCPHCGEDAGGAKEVVVPKSEPEPSVPRTTPGPSLPAVASLPSIPAAPAVPQVLRAKKSSDLQRSREDSPSSRLMDEASEKLPKETLESILMALDDQNLKPKTVKFPARQLYLSAKQGDLQKVIQLLVDGKDPNFVMEGQSRRTPLHAAAAGGHQEICHMLVQAGANMDVFDKEHRTPLMSACENNHLDTVKYLLRAGAAVNHKDLMGFTCLHLAAKLGHYDIAHHLVSKTSKHINCQDDGGWTPITWAIEYKFKELVFLLLAKGADVNIRDKEENVCLHWAALSGCADIAQALLEARCDLNAINIHGDTPLHVAARENHLECVILFLSRGADVSLTNKEGDTALDCCSCGSKVWTALNTNKKLTEARRGRERQGERLLCRDISRGYEAVPITCVNAVDNEPCPDNFKYVPDSCVTSPLNIDKDITRLQHCGCADDCSSSSCMCAQLSLRCWYDSDGRLPLDFCQFEPPVLFECNHACSCWRSCRNRVVQNGLRVRLQLFRTEKMGWGVRAMQDIPQGTFVCEYVGEIIRDTEADKRENDSFLFTLDNKVGDIHCIDAKTFGNIGRFINHLCEPNLLAVRVFTTHQDLRFPRIAFFSSQPIKAGQQIGIDYGENYWRVKSKYFSCQCGSVKCRHSAAGR